MQLSLFPKNEIHPLDELLTDRANALLEALNEDRKDKCHPIFYFQEKDMVVLIASNKNKEMLCNIIDLEGNTPDGFSACWRDASHIKQELKI